MFKQFLRSTRGNFAINLALLALPIMAAAGASVDYTMLSRQITEIQNAADSAALAAALEGGPKSQKMVADADGLFQSNLTPEILEAVRNTRLRVRRNGYGHEYTYLAKYDFDTSFLKLIGLKRMKGDVTATTGSGMTRLEVALVLDTTGSMGQANKMVELKKALNNFLTKFETVRGENAFSVVPFNTQVRLDGFRINDPALTVIDALTKLPLGVTPANWKGCVTDRIQPFDIQLDPAKNLLTAFPLAECDTKGLQTIQPLTKNYTRLKRHIDKMEAAGWTNITIGVQWGIETLSRDAPFSDTQSHDPNNSVRRVMIVLTDGDNTKNRWSNKMAEIDPRTLAMCAAAKTQVDELYTIRVIDGNADLLKQCASTPGHYYSMSKADDLTSVFEEIAARISDVRLMN